MTALAEKFSEQDNGRNHIPDERPVCSARHAQSRNWPNTVNQYEIAGNIHEHAHEGSLHHDFRFTDTAKETRRHIAHQVDDATEHQDVEIGFLILQLVCRQMFHSKSNVS